MSLIGRPSVLFLDEPTTGLDPRSRNAMWDLIDELVHSGMTTLLTTQYLDEADRLADQIAVIDHGAGDRAGYPGRAEAAGRRRADRSGRRRAPTMRRAAIDALASIRVRRRRTSSTTAAAS